jgi:hypothetical protein
VYQGSEGFIKGVKCVSKEKRVYQGNEGCIKGMKGVSRE